MHNKNQLKFIPITMENICLATSIEMKFWPDSCGYNSYLNAYKNGNPYWIIYNGNNEIVGISGIYENPELGEPKTAWLGWYGVLEKFRGSGLGKQILLQTLNIAKKRGFTALRLYSSRREDLCPNAIPFYEKLSKQFNGFVEDYSLEQPEMQRVVVSFSLSGEKITKWNNRPLYLNEDEKDEEDGLKKYNEHLKRLSNIKSNENNL